MKQALYSISSNAEVMPGAYLMWIQAPDIATAAQPGQFVTVRCGDFVLRRPFSIHQVGNTNVIASEAKQSQVALLFKVTGRGTFWLSERKAGEKIDVLGPLGKGFTVAPESRNLLLVAGGIGVAPLAFLVQQALGRAPSALGAQSGRASSEHQITLIHGASTAAQLYPFDYAQNRPFPLASSPLSLRAKRSNLCHLPKGAQFIPVTEDGSTGHKGKATDVLPDYLDWADQIYACGPLGMYEAMSKMSLRAKRSNLKLKECQVSLEVRMGCGFGACYGCTINTRKGLREVCHDGPVFELDDIIWQEVTI
jgi:dihydroorotate dehydrogenase electron transfer subunit